MNNKTLIIYISKKGMTKKLAYIIKDKSKKADIYDIDSFEGDINIYDRIIIGSPIYMGQLNKKIKSYKNSYKDIMLKKDTRFFLCGMNMEDEKDAIKLMFDNVERENYHIQYLGGAYNFDKLNFLQKFIIKKLAKETESREVILEERLVNYL